MTVYSDCSYTFSCCEFLFAMLSNCFASITGLEHQLSGCIDSCCIYCNKLHLPLLSKGDKVLWIGHIADLASIRVSYQ